MTRIGKSFSARDAAEVQLVAGRRPDPVAPRRAGSALLGVGGEQA